MSETKTLVIKPVDLSEESINNKLAAFHDDNPGMIFVQSMELNPLDTNTRTKSNPILFIFIRKGKQNND